MRILVFLFLLFSANYSMAEEIKPIIKIVKQPTFGLPIDCRLNYDCWIMNYVDMGPDDGKKTDPACLERTYDTHKGTDFAVLDGKSMENGVAVLAAADGTIKKIRDGEPDRWPTKEDMKLVQDQRKECGNAILIDHGEGLKTVYCHLKNGSIIVEPDQKVKKGDPIAEVGLSGFTQFPHVHLGILKNEKFMDPFTGQDNTKSCSTFKEKLWDKNLDIEYQPLVIMAAGFSNEIPDLNVIEKEAKIPEILPLSSDKFALWVTMFGARKGDQITIEVKDPNGKIFSRRDITQEKTRARQFYYSGRRIGNVNLIEGAYSGLIKVVREKENGEKQEWTKTVAVLIQS